jgi:hypothetical protein
MGTHRPAGKFIDLSNIKRKPVLKTRAGVTLEFSVQGLCAIAWCLAVPELNLGKA